MFQLHPGSQFYWWRKPEIPQKTTHILQVTSWQTWSHNGVSSIPHPSGIKTHNYHTIAITTTPWHLYILSGSKYKFYTDKSELDFIYIMKKTIYT